MRVFDRSIRYQIIEECDKQNLKLVDLGKIKNHEKIKKICEDNNEYDVLLDKFKINTGVDIPRCHLVYFDTKPQKIVTFKQVIGCARRNALFWRDDIDEKLWDTTKKCFVFINWKVQKQNVLFKSKYEKYLKMPLCDQISIEKLKSGIYVKVQQGLLQGHDEALMNQQKLKLIELEGQTGQFRISYDPKYHANVINKKDFDFYKEQKRSFSFLKKQKQQSLFNEKQYKDYESYTQIYNDREMAIIGPDLMSLIDDKYWLESSVIANVSRYCKFNRFITDKYKNFIKKWSNFGQNSKKQQEEELDAKVKSCLGYCVEYFAKIKIYGLEQVLYDTKLKIIAKQKFDKKIKSIRYFVDKNKYREDIEDIEIVSFAMLIYRARMISVFGPDVRKLIKTKTIEQLIKEKAKKFIDEVKRFGNIVQKFILDKMYDSQYDPQTTKIYDPSLSYKYLKGLCDFITNNVIIDVKCKQEVTENDCKQILAYHYLSTKRTDLNIKKLIIFEAKSQKYVVFDLEEETLTLDSYK